MASRLIALAFAAALAGGVAAASDHDHSSHMASTGGAAVPLFNVGIHHHAVTTSVPLAQRYFDQGLILSWGFNHAQAIKAFHEAARLDPACAMAYWGEAAALGPNINWPMDSAGEAQAYELVQKARRVSPHASESERAYIEALATRYGSDAGKNRGARDSAYADAMRALTRRYPADDDAATLFAESMMDLSPWNQWTPDGKPLPGTTEVVETLERVLKRDPEHPGANHLYIHAIEASPFPERGIPSAERLGKLVPDAGHLVHMPAHIWQRVGNYDASAAANAKAEKVDDEYVAKHKPEGLYPMMYWPHNIHFLWSAACMQGRSAEAIAAAQRLGGHMSADMFRQMPPFEFVSPTLYFALVRFGKWDEILKQPAPPADLRYTTGMWHYARGQALAGLGRLDEAAVERDSVAAIAAATPADALVSFNSTAALLRIASNCVSGEIAARRGQTDEAVSRFHEAMKEEGSLHYDEPPPWFLPVRQELGAVLLAAGRTEDAETAYREDLKHNPENGWSLYGLARCLRARKADAEAVAVEQRFKKAWAKADVKLTASRF